MRRVRRPATEHSPAFDLAYVRSGPRSATPIVVIPGGPGLGSVLPYRGLRRLAAQGGLDLIMVEHRGIGFSRSDCRGRPLPLSAMWVTDVVDDILAVLDREQIKTAYIAGSSYGSYLASTFGARHPERVAGMLLDSALQSATDTDIERDLIRSLFWYADTPVAHAVRRLHATMTDEHGLLDVVRAAYELGGSDLVLAAVTRRERHRSSAVWKALELYAARDESIVRIPGFYEFGIAGTIGFRELGYGGIPDGHPLDPARTYAKIAHHFPAFVSEPYDLAQAAATFTWPMVLLMGSRDVRTPEAIARRVAEAAPRAVIVEIENGHSALDTHPVAFLNAVRLLTLGELGRLAALGSQLSRLPLRGATAHLSRSLSRIARAEAAICR